MRRSLRPPLLALLGLVLGALRTAGAQRGPREFSKQALLVPDFVIGSGVEVRAAARAGDAARDAAKKLMNSRESEVIGGGAIDSAMARSGYKSDGRLFEEEVRALGTHLRADEYLLARVEAGDRGGAARVTGALVLMRDRRLRQPLAPTSAPKLSDAAEALGREAAAARAQLVHQRRCENSLRDGDARGALAHARAGVAAYPQGAIVRVCAVWALKATGASFADVLGAAQEVLAIDPMNAHALDAAASMLDSLRRREESAPLWARLVRTDTTDVVLAERVLYSLGDGGTAVAESLAVNMVREHPEHLPFARHVWRVAFDRKDWPVAVQAAERMLREDSLAVADSVFFRRLGTAYRSAGRPYDAIATLAQGVRRFPGDPRLYALYAQYIKAESDTVLPRGRGLFPKHGELLALESRDLRSRGKLAEAADAMRLAVAADSLIPDGPLMLAQAEFELGRPDSALVALRQAIAGGRDSARVAQFAFARGNALFRAASGTKRSADFALAIRFVAFADSVRTSSQSRLLLGLAALGAAQTGFTEAAADKDRARGCTIAQQASEMLPIARTSLEGGRDVSAETVEQSLGYVSQLDAYGPGALKGLCGAGR